MRRPFAIAAVVLLVLFGGSTACKKSGSPEVAGGTACAADGVTIEDMSLAATARAKDGTVKAFHTTSCLIATIPAGDEWHAWFHDTDGPDWIDEANAVFLIQREGAGGAIRHIRAFKNRESARAFYEKTPGRNEIAPDYSTLRAVIGG